ncbi:hypothetical protein PC9H_005375 [Pleurotus ostreatus]|uniref:Uncharacterized protein n=1 Tax=Pleurotus ostreatus TaxID=5322 RepID=A0A8H7A0C6_PLEOS|nr:uncharacterized protein PC9H_005375 [Pleurotus ostreatus]KAF7433423.1 hypothetical protein PC9H_005375 [Pleurotus ostreatus]KAJ8697879.1 hypothetical protein PTI98_004650 [Pleurotus ostreatus]
MGKKSKAIKSPEERYLVVQHPWGMRKPSTERGKGSVNNLDGWFRIMLRDLVDEDHCSIVVYMVRTQDHVIVEIPEGIDIQPLLGIHRWASILTPSYAAHNVDRFSVIYEYNYTKFDHPKKRGWSESFPDSPPLPPNFPINSPYPPPILHGAMPPQPSLGALPLPAPPSLPPQPVPRTQTSPTPDPRRRLSAGSLARQAESSLPNYPTHRDAEESVPSGRASFDHLDTGRSDSRRTENSEEVRVKQEELQAAVQEYQARQTRDSSTLTNHDGAPRSQSIVKEELNDLVAEYLARVKQEVKQEGCGDRWIKEENDEDERSTTAVTGGSESRERKHDRRSGTLSMSPSRFTEDSESHVVKQEEKDFSWLKQEEEDLTERSSMTASVAPDRGWFKRGGRYEGTIPRQPKRLAEVQDPRLLKRIKSEPQ